MLILAQTLSQLRFLDLMSVYEEGNRENAACFYPEMDSGAALILAEQDFYTYLTEVFFCTKGATYAVWEVSGKYVAALRFEPFQDGELLEALETAPDERGKRYAQALVNAALQTRRGPVYSHIKKTNIASLCVHEKCGFVHHCNFAHCIDGTIDKEMLTLRYDHLN